MTYYLITKTQYNDNHSGLACVPAWNLDGTKCIIQAPDSHTVDNPEQTWDTADQCNNWRYSESEKANWMTNEDINGW